MTAPQTRSPVARLSTVRNSAGPVAMHLLAETPSAQSARTARSRSSYSTRPRGSGRGHWTAD
jgi:hypothetical protein